MIKGWQNIISFFINKICILTEVIQSKTDFFFKFKLEILFYILLYYLLGTTLETYQNSYLERNEYTESERV